MFETPFTMVGNIVTDPVGRRIGDQDLTKFRVASNSRRRTPEGTWEPGNSLFATVNCWGRLAVGARASLRKGDAVIVVGNVYTSEYEDREGIRRSSMEVRATSVGPDLTRCIARTEKIRYPGSSSDETRTASVEATENDPAEPTGEDDPDAPAPGADTGEDVGNGSEALPLSA